MKNCILYNPSCGTCRNARALLEEQGIELPVVEYLKTPPSEKELAEVCKLLKVRPFDLVRQKEAIFSEQKLDKVAPDDDARWYQLLARYPKLLQRPIVILDGKAVVGRPPEKVLELL